MKNWKNINIDEIFDLSIKTNNGKLTKNFIKINPGHIPVYGASNSNIINGKLKDNLIGIKYFENCLTWNTNGSIGKVFFHQERFTITSDVIPLIIRENLKKNLDFFYLKYSIEKESKKENFGFSNKAGKEKIKNIKIKIPIDIFGNFDLNEQKKIAKKIQKIKEIKKNIKMEFKKIENVKIKLI